MISNYNKCPIQIKIDNSYYTNHSLYTINVY